MKCSIDKAGWLAEKSLADHGNVIKTRAFTSETYLMEPQGREQTGARPSSRRVVMGRAEGAATMQRLLDHHQSKAGSSPIETLSSSAIQSATRQEVLQ